jgi:hypothetical protein
VCVKGKCYDTQGCAPGTYVCKGVPPNSTGVCCGLSQQCCNGKCCGGSETCCTNPITGLVTCCAPGHTCRNGSCQPP